MIDYEVLCATIEDWRAGRRPGAQVPATEPQAPVPVSEVDELGSGLISLDDGTPPAQQDMAPPPEYGYEYAAGHTEQLDGIDRY